ncbi:MAG: NAD(P)/FAD-dependent oxidoreductase, partial [Anaerolineae bacterium]|nr:NAD(P)/FAD-dependent oxidoreductase [Anaerolineae bacterium]
RSSAASDVYKSQVLVLEGAETIGGGLRSAGLTLPGFLHDPCSAFHPLGIASPLWRSLPLADHGLTWIHPPAPVAHPFDDGTAVVVEREVAATASQLGGDAAAYRRLMGTFARDWQHIIHEFLGPLRFPHYPFSLVRFGLAALWPAATLARLAFRGERARAVFAGLAAHSIMPLEWPATAAFGFMLGILAHAVGWPIVAGGSQRFADALASYLRSLGGEIRTRRYVRTLADLPPTAATLFDVTPRQLVAIAGERLPAPYRRRLSRYRHGPGVYEVEYALDGPIPWRAAECLRAGTVHVGGTLDEIAAAERAAWQGEHHERPFLIVGQQSLFDPARAPAGKHTVWAYCHVPNGSTVDMTDRITAQIERFAPGFRGRILAAHTRTAAEMAAYNPNYIGGDINGGVQDLRQLFTRPVASLNPYATPARGIYLCSSSTPPGGGVHGMCGYWAAQAAIRVR